MICLILIIEENLPFKISTELSFGRRDFLSGDRLARSLARSCVRACTLAAHGQVLAMPKPSIASDIHKALDVHTEVLPQIALDREFAVDDLADLVKFLL